MKPIQKRPMVLATSHGVTRLLAFVLLLAPVAALAFAYGDVVRKARDLAQTPYQPPAPIPVFLDELDYDQYGEIRFRSSLALWPQRSFHVQFFSPGYLFTEPVVVNVVIDEQVHQVPYAPDRFDYGDDQIAERIPADLGYAGIRLHYDPRAGNLVTGDGEEFLVFLGASYFRGRAFGLTYGLSARGVAIDTGLDRAEEFPRLREFWLLRPAPDADVMTLYALLDGPSITGAYRFFIRPGDQALVMKVDATLFLRHPVTKLGLAPLTSMYQYGIGDHRPPAFLRPAVHDSDGLLIHTADGEWLWRSLRNQDKLTITQFAMTDPRGFGLLQREREFDNYQSLHAKYHNRPSLWITPADGWGKGHIELVEIPTKDEYHDNMVAYWVPETQPEPGQPLQLSYGMRWNASGPSNPVGAVTATRNAVGDKPGTREIIAEFAAGDTNLTYTDIQPSIEIEGGKLLQQRLRRDPFYGVWRLRLQVLPNPGERLDLRARLMHEGKTLTETWHYTLAQPTTPKPE